VAERTYSTGQVAQKLGVHKLTLLRWLYSGQLAEPRRSQAGGVEMRIWTDQDIARAQEFKSENYVAGRGGPREPAESLVSKGKKRRKEH
jgi:hypothetical protein